MRNLSSGRSTSSEPLFGLDVHRLAHIEKLRRGASCATTPGFLDQLDIRLRAAIADRRFVRIHLDDRVVDAHGGERGEHVLDRVHAHRAFADRGRALDRFQVLDRRIDRRFVLQIFALEFDPESRPAAGCNLSVTFSPVCSDVPLKLAALARVCWNSGDTGMNGLVAEIRGCD